MVFQTKVIFGFQGNNALKKFKNAKKNRDFIYNFPAYAVTFKKDNETMSMKIVYS